MKVGILESKKRAPAGSLEPNTFIGGVAAEIPTAAALASKLNISESDISYFAEDGVDVEARIEVDYAIPNLCFYNDENITRYIDQEGKATSVGEFAFSMQLTDSEKLKQVVLPGATIAYRHAFSYNKKLEVVELELLTELSGDRHFIELINTRIYLPFCNLIGNNTTYNAVFLNTKGCHIYCDPMFETINGGNEEPDLADARTNNTIHYISGVTQPLAVTNLVMGDSYGTYLQLNFNVPTTIDPLEFYQVFLDGYYYSEVTKSGDFVIKLEQETSYNITLIRVDENYNKATGVSIIGTTTTTDVPVSKLISYWNLQQENGKIIDLFSEINGDISGADRSVLAKINKGISCVGTGGVVFPSTPILQLTKGAIAIWVKSSDFGSSYRGIFYKPQQYGILTNNNVLGFWDWGSAFVSTGINIADDNWHLIGQNFEDGVNNGTEIIIDGALVLTGTLNQGGLVNKLCIGENNGQQLASGLFDEAVVFKDKLTLSEWANLYNNGNGITL